MTRPDVVASTFVIRLTDKPGAMELIAATFAHRGVSLTVTLGNDGTLDPEGHATVLVHFQATPARKEALKAALSRLSRVVSLVEHTSEDTGIRHAALLRLAPGAPAPAFAPGVTASVEVIAVDAGTGETTYALLGPAPDVEAILNAARAADALRAATRTVLAL